MASGGAAAPTSQYASNSLPEEVITCLQNARFVSLALPQLTCAHQYQINLLPF